MDWGGIWGCGQGVFVLLALLACNPCPSLSLPHCAPLPCPSCQWAVYLGSAVGRESELPPTLAHALPQAALLQLLHILCSLVLRTLVQWAQVPSSTTPSPTDRPTD